MSDSHPRGGSRELLALALPLVLGNGFLTLQVMLDRMMLSWQSTDDVAASFPAAMLFWLPYSLLLGVATYVTTFVAQYTGAGRPERVGPAVWQGLHFSVVTGLAFALLWLLAPAYVGLSGHDEGLTGLETRYFRCLCFAALPLLITGTLSGFFSGRGSPWSVLAINALGMAVNGALAYGWISGRWGFPALGIEGAGYATVAASWASAALALALFLRKPFRERYHTLSGWRPERELFKRLLVYGGPAGLQFAVDVLAFTLFTLFLGQLGLAVAAATAIAVTYNLVAFLPAVGMGQAVSILVGQRLGEERPDLAERSAALGVRWALGYMAVVAAVFVFLPGPLVEAFRTAPADPVGAAPQVPYDDVAAIIPTLLAIVAVYSLADSANIVYACALRGAGDTRYVTCVTFGLAWPVMVLPTWVVVHLKLSVYLAWGFASLYIIVVAACFWLRFRAGHWKAMRVIEPHTAPARDAAEPVPTPAL